MRRAAENVLETIKPDARHGTPMASGNRHRTFLQIVLPAPGRIGEGYAKLAGYDRAATASIGCGHSFSSLVKTFRSRCSCGRRRRKPRHMNTAKKPLWAEAPANSGTIGRNVLDCIGNTPLLRLERLGPNYPNVEFYGKAEWFNPGGSVKDRPALEMIREAERSGQLKPGQTILDATSGNTGIAYAMIAAALGYRVKLCLPASASEERKKILKAYGAELVITPGDEGSDGAIMRAREIIAAEPGKYFYLDQYGNPSNWRAHYKTTANEIWDQTAGRITHFVAGLGTSGTFMGTTRRLKEL